MKWWVVRLTKHITHVEVREMIQLVRDIHRTIHPIQGAAIGVSLDWLERVRDGLIDLAEQMENEARVQAIELTNHDHGYDDYPACEALAEAGVTREDVAQALVEVRAKEKDVLR